MSPFLLVPSILLFLIIFVVINDILPLWTLALWWLRPAIFLIFAAFQCCFISYRRLLTSFTFLRHESLSILYNFLLLF